ncbi:MAG: hypothetical protein AAB547_00640 [Patescibacteria group bacterium]
MRTTMIVARFSVISLSAFFCFLIAISSASAATTVTGTIVGHVTWTTANSPYIANNVIVPAGSSLVVEPGVVVKVPKGSWAFTVYGTLTIGTLGSEKTVMTSLLDDAISGDTNADGSLTLPSSIGDWNGIQVIGGTTNIANTALYYGGYNVSATVYNQGGIVSVSHSEFSRSNHSFILLDGSTTEIYASTIRDNDEYALWQKGGILRFGNNIFTNNTIAILLSGGMFQNDGNNSGESGIYLRNRTLSGATVFSKDTLPYVVNNITVPAGSSLVIEPGATVKAANTNWALYVYGTLTVGAADAEKVTITSLADDTVGGDTNNDGAATIPAKGNWCSINIAGGVTTIVNTVVRYGGCPSAGQITNYGADVTITGSQFSESNQYHIRNVSGQLTLTSSELTASEYGLGFHGGSVVMRDNSIHGNTGYGVYNLSPVRTVIDATNNWWGDASGPRHPSNPQGIGDAVTNYVFFDPWLGNDPLLGCIVNCYSNVLFLPGLEASRLYAGDDKLWEPYGDADVEKLYLDEDGKSIRNDIITRDVIDNAYVPIKGNIYKSFLSDLDEWKNTDNLIADYVVAPYDWRLSLDDILNSGKKTGENISYTEPTASPYIIQELRRLASTSKSGKITLIAHSNGGLVAKALTDKLGAEAADLIDKIVFVAVPQSGTPQAIGAILHGYDQGLPVSWFPFTLTPKTARTLAQNMPSAYNLLPSDAYFSGEGSGIDTPVITFEDGASTDSFIGKYGKKIDSSSELRDFLSDNEGKVSADSANIGSPSSVNSGLLAYGENTHQALDDNWSAPAGVSVYQIAGFGEETLGTIKYWTGQECLHEGGKICSSRVPKLEYTPELVVDGDGTVVASSALAMSTSAANVSRWWVDLHKYNNELPGSLARFDGEHANILEVSELRNFIKENILTQSSSIFPDYISNVKPTTNDMRRLRYFLHSPLTLSARDSSGNMISATEDAYPGATYRRFGEVQYISVPADSSPTLVLDGLDTGSFTLEVQEVSGGEVTETTTFSAIPASPDTEVTMNFSDGTIENASPLTVDYDGDGTTDFSLAPKPGETVTIDTLAPTTTATLSGTVGSNDWYTSDVTVTLSAADNEGGSGVEKIEYSIDSSAMWSMYAEPFIISKEGVTDVRYFSTDKQGNKGEVKTKAIKIDKTAPEAKIQFNPATQKLDVIGIDVVSGVVVTNTETVSTVTDEAGHTLTLTFSKVQDKQRRIVRTLESIAYDGITTPLAATLRYKWVYNEKKGGYRFFVSHIRTDIKVLESHYRPKKNITVIMEKPRDLNDSDEDDDVDTRPTKAKLPGMVVPGIVTESGQVNITY